MTSQSPSYHGLSIPAREHQSRRLTAACGSTTRLQRRGILRSARRPEILTWRFPEILSHRVPEILAVLSTALCLPKSQSASTPRVPLRDLNAVRVVTVLSKQDVPRVSVRFEVCALPRNSRET